MPGTRVRRRRLRPQFILFCATGVAVVILLLWLLFSLLFPGGGAPSAASVTLPDWVQEAVIPVNPYSRPGEKLTAVNGVVVHYVGNPGTSAQQNRDYFAGLAETQDNYASSNFIVGLEGEVLLCVPVDEVAYCSNGRNSDTISIEVCHPDATGEFSEVTRASVVRLVSWLKDTYRLDKEDIIRHYDVTGKECPLYYVKNPDAWEQFKNDVWAYQEEE